jgi:hypothetical protein
VNLVALALLAAAVLLALYDWRRGLYGLIVIGFLQDPLRKLIPGQSVVYTVMVVAAFLGVALGAIRAGEMARFGELFRWFPRLRAPFAIFTFIVLAQSFVTLFRTGNWILAGLGVLSYLGPVAAIVVGQRAFASVEATLRWHRFYALATLAVAGTVFAQFAGYRPAVLRSIGLETVYGIGGRIEMMCGAMRSSEIAAWHLGVGASLMLAFAVGARARRARVFTIASILLLLVAVFLAGRRKMLAEFVLYVLCLGVFLLGIRGGASRLLRYLPYAGMVALVGGSLLIASGRLDTVTPYLNRGWSVVGESGSRLEGMTTGMFGYIIAENGILGSGAGTGAQGSQYYGGGTQIVGGAAEGGAGKLLAELGVPGAIAAIWLALSLGIVLRRIIHLGRSVRPEAARLFFGLAALFPANAAVFLTAHQVFGDPFVVLLLGLMVGATLALPRHAYLEARQAEAIAAAPAGRPAIGRSR